MDLSTISLRDYASAQLRDLHKAIGFAGTAVDSMNLLNDLLGPGGARALSEPPLWPSGLSDDKTPIEFSVAFEDDGLPSLRLCVDPIAEVPSHAANLQVSREILESLASRFGFSLDQFHAVSDLFLAEELRGKFVLWLSVVLRLDAPPTFKVYFNPEAQGLGRAPHLIEKALGRLGFHDGFPALSRHALRHGMNLDRFTIFSLDLGEKSRSRVKVYASHYTAEVTDIERAASVARGIEFGRLRDFCYLIGGGPGPFAARPLISSYAFVEGDTDRPSGYTLHLPVRDYVTDDEASRARVIALLSQHGFDSSAFERVLTSVARRPLSEGVGLIPYASLRLGVLRPGVTVYLSSEIYDVAPPRSWRSLADNFSYFSQRDGKTPVAQPRVVGRKGNTHANHGALPDQGHRANPDH
jgi:DMATS type aromatic prenyltransferase